MRKVLMSAAIAGLVSAFAVPTWSATTPPQLPQHPPAIGLCRTNKDRLEICIARWKQCLVTAHRGVDPCPGEWRLCCTRGEINHPPVNGSPLAPS